VVLCLEDLAKNSNPQIHVSKKYPINYNPLNFTASGKKYVMTEIYVFTIFPFQIMGDII